MTGLATITIGPGFSLNEVDEKRAQDAAAARQGGCWLISSDRAVMPDDASRPQRSSRSRIRETGEHRVVELAEEL
jgi:hypothetical protein